MHSAWWREEREFSKHSTVPADCVYPTGCFGCPILHLVLAGNAIALSFSSRSATTGQNPAHGHSRAAWAGADDGDPSPSPVLTKAPGIGTFYLSVRSQWNHQLRREQISQRSESFICSFSLSWHELLPCPYRFSWLYGSLQAGQRDSRLFVKMDAAQREKKERKEQLLSKPSFSQEEARLL